MDGSTSNTVIIKKDSDGENREISNPHHYGGDALVVCGWSFLSHFFFTFLLVSCIPCFAAASVAVASPTAIFNTAPPPTPPLNLSRTGGGQRGFDLVIVVSVSVLCVVGLFSVMAFFACLRFRARRRTAVEGEGEGVAVVVDGKGEKGVRRFSREEVERFSANFSRSRVIAYGGFSTVYLGKFSDSRPAAIKIIDGSSERLHRIFQQELEILLMIQHNNIVKILGYSDEEGSLCTLFLEYVSNGTLHDKLHGPKGSLLLPWKNRTTIAFQLAQALDYLHEHCDMQIVHGDIKASNILLDSEMNCKLCDFGSAKMGFSSTVLPPSSRRMIPMIGSPGYADPHYLRTGIASKKNDIYSYGVILLELITGLEALSSDNSTRLISKVGPMLKDVSKVAEMVDRRLAGEYELEEAMAMASLAALCLSDPPSLRPSAADIIETIRNCVASVTFPSSTDKML